MYSPEKLTCLENLEHLYDTNLNQKLIEMVNNSTLKIVLIIIKIIKTKH
jgi:hypothetical protein